MEVHEPDFDYTGTYTYADYLKWTIDERLELIKGKIFRMSPAPNRRHQHYTGHLFRKLGNFLERKSCQVYIAPFDVRLPRKSNEDKDVITVVQPDICVVCDPSKLDDKGCIGAPDIMVEVLSPGNSKKELRNKYEVYEESGVKEYWIVSPQDEYFLAYRLNEAGKYVPSRLMAEGDMYETPILPGFILNIGELFADY